MGAYRFDVERIKSPRPADAVLVASVILLAGVGLVTLFSGSSAFADRFFGDDGFFLRKQAMFGAVGLILMVVAASVDAELLRRYIKPLVFGAFFLCVLTFIPGIGMMRNGATRWISVGSFSYQPSELVKIILPVYLAHIFAKKEETLGSVSSGVLPPAIVVFLFCFVIYLQNNFSTAAFIGANALGLFFLAGVKIRHLFGTALLATPIAALLILSKEHRLQRIMTFLSPDADPLGAGYQVRASIETLATGGLWGKGLGRGTRKVASVPEIQSDFIFSSYSEEFGFVGVVLFFAIFAIFTSRGYRAALRSEDSFKRLLAFGLTTMIASQALLNVAVVSGAVPATGVPLPFFSAGGSSFATTLLMAGILINVSRNHEKAEVTHVR
jgi:cell division protein FtsW